MEVVHWFLERPHEPVAARYAASEREALERRLGELLERARERVQAFPVSPEPHRGLCLTCPGSGRPLLAGARGDDARGSAGRPGRRRSAAADPLEGGVRAVSHAEQLRLPGVFAPSQRCYAFWLRLRCPPACATVGMPAKGVQLRAGCTVPREHFHEPAQHAAAKGRRPLRPPLRARRVRRGHGGAAGQPADARGGHAGDDGAREPRAPRRLRGGPEHGRRRGDPDADARRAAARGRRLRAAAAGRIRRADVLPADRHGPRAASGVAARADRRRPRVSGCSAGATCRSTRSTPARSRAPAAR